MTDAEKRVREVWLNARYDGHRVLADNPNGKANWILSGNINAPFEGSHHLSERDAWQAALAFTEVRLKEIAELEEEIALVEGVSKTTAAFISSIYVHGHIKQDAAKESPVWKRFLARLQAALAELGKGMKERQ